MLVASGGHSGHSRHDVASSRSSGAGCVQLGDVGACSVGRNVVDPYRSPDAPRVWSIIMAKRAESDEHYVLDLCDEVLASRGERQARFDWLLGDTSPTTGRASQLPVDGYWPELSLVVEFQEKQHTESVPIFDRRMTVSGISRGEQRRKYDDLKVALVPAHGLRLVVIHKRDFVTKRDLIVRDHERDLGVVRRHLAE